MAEPKPRNLGGRPLKFKSVEELQQKIDAFFADCDPHWVDDIVWEYPKGPDGKIDRSADMVERKLKRMTAQQPYTITGLALALDTSREGLLNYEGRGQYFDTIKRAKLKCQNYAEHALYGQYSSGPIFSLKANYLWKDQQSVDLTSGGKEIAVPILGGMTKKDVPADNSTPEAQQA